MKIKILILFLFLSTYGFCQKYLSRDATITFFSEAPLENIEAVNKAANTIIDLGTGRLVFKVVIKSFYFKKAAMQKHFNIKYLESDTYPNATFKGKIENFEQLDLSLGKKHIEILGKMSIHGVEKDIKVNANLEKTGDKLILDAKFSLAIADYNIKVPGKLIENIAEVINVSVNAILNPIK